MSRVLRFVEAKLLSLALAATLNAVAHRRRSLRQRPLNRDQTYTIGLSVITQARYGDCDIDGEMVTLITKKVIGEKIPSIMPKQDIVLPRFLLQATLTAGDQAFEQTYTLPSVVS